MAEKTKSRRAALRGMSDADTTVIIADAHKSIYNFRKDRLSKPVTDVKVVKHARKEIARILTIRREKQLGIEHKG